MLRIAGFLPVWVAFLVCSVVAQQPGCQGADVSRWSAASGYRAAETFGTSDDAYIESFSGIATTRTGDVFVYDGRSATIFRLDARLRLQGTFGRKGGGPGELAVISQPQPRAYMLNNYLAADDSLIYVFDWRALNVFRHDGRYVGRNGSVRGGPMFLTMKGLKSTPYGVMYGFDSTEISASANRRLQTWSIRGQEKNIIHELSLPSLPGEGGRFTFFPGQANALWAGHDRCVVVSDGESQLLIRVDLQTRRLDTLRLPRHDVPKSTNENAQAKLRKFGIDMPDGKPTAVWRWAELIVDPDGHIWVNPWRPSSNASGSFVVYRIDPRGRVNEERVQAFPQAFGPPGVYYSRRVDSETDENLIVRFVKRQ